MRGVNVIFHSELPDAEVKRRKYAFPEERRFPLTDRAHVMSAIKFFNYAKPDEEARLAKAILKRMRELGMTDVNVGEDNRFKGYYERSMKHGDEMTTKPIFSDDRDEYLEHYGVKGMKWHKHIYSQEEASDILKSKYATEKAASTAELRTPSKGPVLKKAQKHIKNVTKATKRYILGQTLNAFRKSSKMQESKQKVSEVLK